MGLSIWQILLILVINTEGDTDPVNYKNIVSQSKKIIV